VGFHIQKMRAFISRIRIITIANRNRSSRRKV
jgi:hypothetical protein